jgi:hypothetical protein
MPVPREFFSALWRDEEGFAELRCFGGNYPKGLQEFYEYPSQLEEFCARAEALSGKTGVYYGVGLRSKKSGKKEDVKAITCLWIDVDENVKEALKRVKKFPIQPSAGVWSGRPSGGAHIYWFLKEPVTGEDLPKVRAYNRALAKALGGDPGATDIARVLRVPGTENIKYTL